MFIVNKLVIFLFTVQWIYKITNRLQKIPRTLKANKYFTGRVLSLM